MQSNSNPSTTPLYQNNLTDNTKGRPSNFISVTSNYWKRNENTVSSTRANQVGGRSYLNQSIDKYGTGRPRAYRGTSNGKETLIGLGTKKVEETIYADERNGIAKRDSSVIDRSTRTRER